LLIYETVMRLVQDIRNERSRILGKINALAKNAADRDDITVAGCREVFEVILELFSKYNELSDELLKAIDYE